MNKGIGFDLNIMTMLVNFDLEITNLLDEDYRDFLDTYKSYALWPGRSVNFKLSVPIGKYDKFINNRQLIWYGRALISSNIFLHTNI